MPKKFDARGGASSGGASASWPLARLEVDREKIILKVLFFEKYTFNRTDIIKVEQYGVIPILTRGVRIFHNKPEYPEEIVFYPIGSSARIIRSIGDIGFPTQPSQTSNRRIEDPAKRGSPVKILPIVLVVLIWNFLFLYEMNWNPWASPKAVLESPGVVAAFAMVFGLSVGVRLSGAIARIFMKSGRHVSEIAPSLSLIAIISGLMLVFVV
jgi:hypothetical protein